MFQLSGVSKSFGATRVLGPIDLEVAAARTSVIIGPSGCGKSTLLRLLVGILTPSTGTIRFNGTPLNESTIMAARLRMGYVIQDGGLFPHLTARANVELLPRHLGWKSQRISARIEQLLKLTRLPPEALAAYPANLSGGQRQRVSLMRALALDPDVLLLDEPLGALDPMIRHDLQNELKDIFRALKKTVVLVTHDLAEAGYFADQIVLLRDGLSVQRGTLDDLILRPADPFVTRFVNAQRSLAPLLATGAAAEGAR